MSEFGEMFELDLVDGCGDVCYVEVVVDFGVFVVGDVVVVYELGGVFGDVGVVCCNYVVFVCGYVFCWVE